MKALDEGYKAFHDGIEVNPYANGSVKRTYWRKGWLAAAKRCHPLTVKDFARIAAKKAGLSPTGRTPSQPEIQSLKPSAAPMWPTTHAKAVTAEANGGERAVGMHPAMAAPYGEPQDVEEGYKTTVEQFTCYGTSLSMGALPHPLDAVAEHEEIVQTLSGSHPVKKLLASTSGTITALKTARETAASWYVTYYGEGGKEVRISKNDPRRRVVDTLEAAEAWASGEHPGIAQIPKRCMRPLKPGQKGE
jgi:hypothetical protein